MVCGRHPRRVLKLRSRKPDAVRKLSIHHSPLLFTSQKHVCSDTGAAHDQRRHTPGCSMESLRQCGKHISPGRASPRTSALARSSGGPMKSQNLAGEVVAARRLRRVRVNPHQKSVRLHDGMHAAAKYGRRP